MKNSKKLMLILLAPLGYLLFFLSSFTPNIVEKVYSNFIFKGIAKFFSILTGFIPISVGEFFIVLIFLFLLIKLIFLIIKIFKKPSTTFKLIRSAFLNILVILSIAYFSLYYYGVLTIKGYPLVKLPI